MSDGLEFWRDSLAGKKPEINADAPQKGYYKARRGKDGPLTLVAIWDREGERVARFGDEMIDPLKVWTWCADKPVSAADKDHYKEHGRFPGDIEPPAGHNSGDLSLLDQLRDYIATASAWLKGREIKTKIEADQCQNYRTEVLRLKGLVDKERDAKVRPHLDAQRAIQAEYKPILDEAEAINKLLRTAPEAFAKAEEKRLEAELRAKWEAEQERVRKEREAIEAERAKKLAEDPIAALTESEPELPIAPPPPEPVKMQIGGQRGRVGGLKGYWEAEITDYPAALQHYANHPDVRALIEKLAKAEVKLNKGAVTIPGVRPYEDRRIA
jgi:hypothetical protein